MIKLLFAVCLGGAVGSMLRFLTGIWMSRHIQFAFPLSTFIVNVVGCFLIGLFYAFSTRFQWFTPGLKLFFISGFCGGLTTFSAFAYENIKLLQDGNAITFLLYSIGSFALCLLAVVAGISFVRMF